MSSNFSHNRYDAVGYRGRYPAMPRCHVAVPEHFQSAAKLTANPHGVGVCGNLSAIIAVFPEQPSNYVGGLRRGVAYGVTPCAKKNHTLRNKSGNCLQCYPASIGYENNHNRGGYIYIAQSKAGKIIKIGTTENILVRTKTLNEQKYGSQLDWIIPVSREVKKNCGQIEKAMHAKLKEFYVIGRYLKDGTTQSTYELFKYPIEEATQNLDEILKNLQNNAHF